MISLLQKKIFCLLGKEKLERMRRRKEIRENEESLDVERERVYDSNL